MEPCQAGETMPWRHERIYAPFEARIAANEIEYSRTPTFRTPNFGILNFGILYFEIPNLEVKGVTEIPSHGG